MQNLALIHLWQKFGNSKNPPHDLRGWFNNLRKNDGGKFFPFLVEPSGKIERYYALKADSKDPDNTILDPADMASLDNDSDSGTLIPFNKPSGPRSSQLGPVIKIDKKATSSPSPLTLKDTLKSFDKISEKGDEWSKYFSEICSTWRRNKVDGVSNEETNSETALHHAVKRIKKEKNKVTVYLVYEDEEGRLPGDVPEYQEYLSKQLDADQKYTTEKAQGKFVTQCSLCGTENVKAYAAGCSAAGINISNIDREGAFPELTNSNAHLSYAICSDCADLLYVFKFHVISNYQVPIMERTSLILPNLNLNSNLLGDFIRNFQKYVNGLSDKKDKALAIEQKKLLRLLSKEKVTITIDILWAKFGQKIEKIHGAITQILPSRLLEMHKSGKDFHTIQNPFFPNHPVSGYEFDLNLSFLHCLFQRPGGQKAKNINESKKFFELKRLIAEGLYKKRQIPEQRFWDEIMVTARWYLTNIFILDSKKLTFELLHEGYSDKKRATWLTLAGWVKHLAMTLEYFKKMEVIENMKNKRTYEPESDLLKPYFRESSGINTDQKAFAFILGILYGKVMSVQGAKEFNVGTNSLTWLKRLTLNGSDLPELYNKVRGKLLAYETEKSSKVRELISELGRLTIILGDQIILKQTECCYFLLVGQSLSVHILPKPKGKDENNNKNGN